MKTKKRNRMKLSWLLVILIVLCWILPMILTLVTSGILTSRGTRNRVSDLVTASVENTTDLIQRDLDQVVNDLLSVSYEPTIRSAYLAFNIGGGTDQRGLINGTQSYLEQKFYRNELTNAVYVIFPNAGVARTYDRGQLSYSEASAFYNTELFKNTEDYMQWLDTDVLYVYENDRLYLIRLLTLHNNEFTPYAMIVADLNIDNIFGGLNNLPWVTDITLRIGDNLLLLRGDQPEWTGDITETESAATTKRNLLTVTQSAEANRYVFGYHITADLTLPIREMSAGTSLILVIALFSALLMGFLFYFIMRQVNRPIAQLGALAKQIEHGELGAQCEVDALHSAEFMYLGTRMNEMSAQLQEQFERLYREELALRDAQIEALQSQINPHFLGNTLEIINWEARLAGDVKASQMLEALSTLLHATQDRDRRPLVHLSEEMMYINAYLFIIGARLGKRLQVQHEIDESLLDWFVPRLILQPIVENAVEHGVGIRQRGTITIRASKIDDEWMRLEVENDSPLSPADEKRVRQLLEEEPRPGESSRHIGIRNVNKRLCILYGKRGALTIRNVKNSATVSSMCIQNNENSQKNAT